LRPLDLFLAVAVNLVWGLNFAVTKLGIEEMPPMLVVSLRYGLVALLLSPWLRWPGDKFWQIAGISFTLGFVHFSLMFTGLKGIDASIAAIAVQVQVPFSAILAFFIFKDRLGWKRSGGIALAIAGVVMIATSGGGHGHDAPDPFYLSLVIGAALAWSISHIHVKVIGHFDTLVLNAWIALMAAPQLLLGSILIEGTGWTDVVEAPFFSWFAIVYMAVGVTVFGYGIWYRLIQRYDVNQVVPLSLLAPTFGVLSGIFILGEAATLEKFVGGAMTLTGVAIVTLIKPPPAAAVSPKPN